MYHDFVLLLCIDKKCFPFQIARDNCDADYVSPLVEIIDAQIDSAAVSLPQAKAFDIRFGFNETLETASPSSPSSTLKTSSIRPSQISTVILPRARNMKKTVTHVAVTDLPIEDNRAKELQRIAKLEQLFSFNFYVILPLLCFVVVMSIGIFILQVYTIFVIDQNPKYSKVANV